MTFFAPGITRPTLYPRAFYCPPSLPVVKCGL
ncbi:hypothetical protein [Flavonifractor phage Cormatin]|nr:hypothetical protein [Flavonifractor phage Cormatin]